MEKTKRYIIATAGILLHLMLGSTYAWSVYRIFFMLLEIC